MSVYPLANHEVQWFGDKFSSAAFTQITRLVLHATEGRDWPAYEGGAVAPNMTVRLAPGFASMVARQHFDTLESSRALVNAPGGVLTNTHPSGVFQVEIVGTSSRKVSAGWQRAGYVPGHDYVETFNPGLACLNWLADLVIWLHRYYHLPLAAYPSWPDADVNEAGIIGRMTGDQWNNWTGGLIGHSGIPENNHRDPGAFPALQLLSIAELRLDPSEGKGGADMPDALLLNVTDQNPKHPDVHRWLWSASGGLRPLVSTTEVQWARDAGIREIDVTEADVAGHLPPGYDRP